MNGVLLPSKAERVQQLTRTPRLAVLWGSSTSNNSTWHEELHRDEGFRQSPRMARHSGHDLAKKKFICQVRFAGSKPDDAGSDSDFPRKRMHVGSKSAGQANRTVLVTGGAGYIGAHACKALARAGYLPVAYDNLVYGHEWAVKWGPLEKGDILDGNRLAQVFTQYRPAAVMHFAAYAYVGESVSDPAKYYRNNVTGSLTLLEAARDHGTTRIVFSSTCATYGIPAKLPISEETLQRPINPYGASKLMVERILSDFSQAHAMRWSALRYFNAAGADIDSEIGEAHTPETHLIPLVLNAATGRGPAVSVLGTDYDTPDGTCVRDYVHVSDLASAHVLALQAIENGASSAAYNLGIGRGYSVQEVISAVGRVTRANVPFVECPRRQGDPSALVSDPTKARMQLKWEPKVTDLDDIIRTAWRWEERHSGQG